MRPLLLVLTGCLLAAYPVIVYLGLQQAELGWLGSFLILIGLLRLILFRDRDRGSLVSLLLILMLMLAGTHALLSESAAGLRHYPVAVNALFLLFFASSLYREQTVIEQIARRQDPGLSTAGVAYTRKVTIAWCVFFLTNGLIAFYTALWASLETWALYNGLVAYLLMGLLFGIEWLIRRSVRRSMHDQA